MTDEELIAMARLAQRDDRMSTGALYGDLADRIEALIEESARRLALARSEGVARVEQFERNEALTELLATTNEQLAAARQDAKEAEDYAEELETKLATCEKYRDAYDEMGRIGTQAVRDLEAKLAKAVEALSDLMMHEPDHPDTIWEKARTTLAEIKGGKDE